MVFAILTVQDRKDCLTVEIGAAEHHDIRLSPAAFRYLEETGKGEAAGSEGRMGPQAASTALRETRIMDNFILCTPCQSDASPLCHVPDQCSFSG